ncbi:MAG TPA: hypothetical protein ENJ18_06400 [Nannocystis exedens]|nr:hypothetical protein [Nannocystis exedens]
MNTTNGKFFGLMVSGLALGLGATAMQGCEQANKLAEQCGLVCPDKGILEGNASISGIASMDAFFGAVLDYSASINTVNANIRGELDAMAISVGLEPGAAGADIKAAIDAKLNAAISGGLKITAKPAQCSASVDIAASAAAECDVEVDPGEVDVRCEGSCTIDASAQADCAATGNLRCEGTAPNLECSGTCTGDCNLQVAGTCEGTCNGTCDGTCSVENGNGDCAGACDGMCQGTCELTAGGSCEGQCEGTCEWDPGMAECDAGLEARCEAAAEANVACEGGCKGTVEPPEVSAECSATVEAKAEASIECTPPSIDISWQWSAELEGDVKAQGEFKAWITGFKGQLAGLLAATAKAEILVDGVANLSGAAEAAVSGAATELQASGDLKASIGAACALTELKDVAGLLGSAGGELKASLEASVEITAMAGG